MINSLRSDICGQLANAFRCDVVGERIRIETPFTYPDGDIVEVYVRPSTLIVSDLGETISRYRSMTDHDDFTYKQRLLVDEVLESQQIDLHSGMLIRQCRHNSQFPSATIELAQASLRVLDALHSVRRPVGRRFDRVFEDWILATFNDIVVRKSFPVRGASGRDYRVGFETRVGNRKSLVHVSSPGSEEAAKSMVDHVVTMWFDLQRLQSLPENRITVLDDRYFSWSPSLQELLESSGSKPVKWSNQERLRSLIGHTAA